MSDQVEMPDFLANWNPQALPGAGLVAPSAQPQPIICNTAVSSGFACPLCKRVFARKGDLVRHQQTHGDNSQYYCYHAGCSRRDPFRRKDNLVNHVANVHTHDKVVAKQFVEEWAPYNFHYKANSQANLSSGGSQNVPTQADNHVVTAAGALQPNADYSQGVPDFSLGQGFSDHVTPLQQPWSQGHAGSSLAYNDNQRVDAISGQMNSQWLAPAAMQTPYLATSSNLSASNYVSGFMPPASTSTVELPDMPNYGSLDMYLPDGGGSHTFTNSGFPVQPNNYVGPNNVNPGFFETMGAGNIASRFQTGAFVGATNGSTSNGNVAFGYTGLADLNGAEGHDDLASDLFDAEMDGFDFTA